MVIMCGGIEMKVDVYEFNRGSVLNDNFYNQGYFNKKFNIEIDVSKVESIREVNTSYTKFNFEKKYFTKFWGLLKTYDTICVEEKTNVTYYETTMSSGKTYLLDVNLFKIK